MMGTATAAAPRTAAIMMPTNSPEEIPLLSVGGFGLGDVDGIVAEPELLLPVVPGVVEPLDFGATGSSDVRIKMPSVAPVVHV